MKFLPLIAENVGHVLYNLRPEDREEVTAELGWFNSTVLAEMIAACRFGIVAADDNEVPIAVMSADLERPGVLRVGMLCTPRFNKVAWRLTLWARQAWPTLWERSGAHRAHCYSMLTHQRAHKWIRAIGGQPGPVLEGYGSQGQHFIMYHWLRWPILHQRSQAWLDQSGRRPLAVKGEQGDNASAV